MSSLNNKTILIPAILGTIIVITGIFAFMPIEKVTTVHGTLPTSTTLTTETQGLDQFATFRVNFTNNYKQLVTLIPSSSGTITGHAILTALPNSMHNRTTGGVEQQFQCGLSTTNNEKLGINVTQGNSTSLALSAVLSANEGIVVEAVNSTNTVPGTCIVTLILDSSTG